uniref:Aminopeptidase n=1 Tax=Poecilia reticulata TaxID=8081 RepID=A0A3P9PC93_POERE
MPDSMSMDLERKGKRYCIRGKHAAIICATVVVCSLAVAPTGAPTVAPTGAPTVAPTVAPTGAPTDPPPSDRGPCLASSDSSGDWKNFRLPDYVKPIHYDLHLEPNLVDDTYTGTVDIQVEVSKPTRHLWLHIRETFVNAKPRLKVQDSNGVQRDVEVNRCFEYKPEEYVVVEAAEELPATDPGQVYVLSLDFQGLLTGSVVGFYRVVYTEEGVTKKIAATDHEPTDARKSFPCFDEPNKKATYSISITHDKNYGALSNMPSEGSPEELPDNKLKTTFQKSIPMSTYLVCFAVHQFGFVERTSASNIPLRIYAQPSQLKTAEYAANVTKVIFDHFEEYFNMSYSISKLDKIAIPDFGTGAMENWGLITYRETNLLYDETESSSSNKQRVASVIAHELVHQWFGNIVTMDWWDDLWLNEGFASFFEYIGVEEAEPTWGMRDIMIISDVLPVLVDDALVSSHPIIVDVSSPAEITSVFDAISYNKGASVLRMLEDWMGRDAFRDGCRKYLKEFYFKNAKTANFWASLVSNLPVAEVMDTWTKQMGYPVVDVTISESNAKLTQKRFLLDPLADPSQPNSPFQYKWTIPVKWYSVKSNKIEETMFNKSTAELAIIDYSPSADGLLKINNDHIGFYRVNHEDSMWTVISQQLQDNHTTLDAADRTSFIDDVFALARADVVDYGNAFNLTKYLSEESEYIVWSRVASSIAYVRDMLYKSDTKLLRETVLSIACQMGDADALKEASDIFKQWIDKTISSVPVNLRLLVYRYGMKMSGNADHWNQMFQRYKDSTLAQEKDKLLYGLASVEDTDLLNKLLEATKDETVVRSQDLFTVVRYVSYNPLGQTMAWDWTTLNWDYLVSRYTINDRNLGRLPNRITTSYNTKLQLWQMENFFKLTPDAGAGQMPREQALETVRNNIEWIQKNEPEIQAWLESNVP